MGRRSGKEVPRRRYLLKRYQELVPCAHVLKTPGNSRIISRSTILLVYNNTIGGGSSSVSVRADSGWGVGRQRSRAARIICEVWADGFYEKRMIFHSHLMVLCVRRTPTGFHTNIYMCTPNQISTPGKALLCVCGCLLLQVGPSPPIPPRPSTFTKRKSNFAQEFCTTLYRRYK